MVTNVTPADNRGLLTRIAGAVRNRNGGAGKVRDRKPVLSGDSGQVTRSGNGSTTVFTVPHDLGQVPTAYYFRGMNAASSATSTVAVSGTAFTVTFSAAPPAGTDNLVFSYIATV